MKTEKVKKGSDWNDTKLSEFAGFITDDNFEFKGYYKIIRKIEKDGENKQ